MFFGGTGLDENGFWANTVPPNAVGLLHGVWPWKEKCIDAVMHSSIMAHFCPQNIVNPESPKIFQVFRTQVNNVK